jgi:acyl carrier protein
LNVADDIKSVLAQVLSLEDRARYFSASTLLFGAIAELDSRAVVTLVAALEDKFGIVVEDDEITAEVFETVGSLTEFVERKLAA